MVHLLQRSFSAIQKCKIPVIAKVHGLCLGGAIDLISACDMVYAEENSSFAIREVKIGMSPDLGTIQRLSLKSKNHNLFKELAFTGRFFDNQEAMEIGLIAGYFSKEKLNDRVQKVAQEIAENSPTAIYVVKQSLNQMN